jgi:hypothetical protein
MLDIKEPLNLSLNFFSFNICYVSATVCIEVVSETFVILTYF